MLRNFIYILFIWQTPLFQSDFDVRQDPAKTEAGLTLYDFVILLSQPRQHTTKGKLLSAGKILRTRNAPCSLAEDLAEVKVLRMPENHAFKSEPVIAPTMLVLKNQQKGGPHKSDRTASRTVRR